MSSWFVKMGWIHRPVSAAGWVVTAAAAAYMIQVFLALDANAHSVSDLLYGLYPHWGITFLGWDWIARNTARGQTG